MRQFWNFLKKIKSFWKLYKDYGYDGETIEFIIDTYEKLLCERTKTMSKPTYYLKDILAEIDRWYEEHEEIRMWRTDNKFAKRIDFSIWYDELAKNELADLILRKIEESR